MPGTPPPTRRVSFVPIGAALLAATLLLPVVRKARAEVDAGEDEVLRDLQAWASACDSDESCLARHNREVRECQAKGERDCGRVMTLAEWRKANDFSLSDPAPPEPPEDELPLMLIMGLLGAFVLASPVAVVLFMRRRTRAAREALEDAGEDAGEDARCVACNSKRVERPEPDILRCQDCGYEGGAGVARRQEAAKRDALRWEPTERLVAAAADDLATAAEELTTAGEAAQWFARHGVSLSLDTTEYIAASGGGRTGERQEWEYRLDTLMRHTYQALSFLQDAARRVEIVRERGDAPPELDLHGWRLGEEEVRCRRGFESLRRAGDVAAFFPQIAAVIEAHRARLT